MSVTETAGGADIDRRSGSSVMYRSFSVQRPGGQPHTVRVEVSHSGTPQAETCDCRGFRFRHACSHIDAVYAAGVLSVHWD